MMDTGLLMTKGKYELRKAQLEEQIAKAMKMKDPDLLIQAWAAYFEHCMRWLQQQIDEVKKPKPA